MKNHSIKIFLIALIAMILANGCIKLEEETFGQLSPETFYSSEADLQKAAVGLFRSLANNRHLYDAIYMLIPGAGADDVGIKPGNAQNISFDRLNVSPTGKHIQNHWKYAYQGINNSNGIIGNIGNISGVSEENLNKYEGQARFVRALMYFNLTRFFGEVPIIDETNGSEADHVGQSSVSDIYNFIVNDLQLAENQLATSYPEPGFATKGAAKALLAKVYLTMAGWPLEDTSNYAKARDKAKEVMDMQKYKLEPNFQDLWLAQHKFSEENIFTAFASQGTGSGSQLHIIIRPSSESGYATLFSEVRFFNKFPEGPRKDATFWTTFLNGSSWENDIYKSPYFGKFRDAGETVGYYDNATTINGNGWFAIFRYAEVLLIYAEAANMAESGPSAAALEAINQVRRRAGGNDQGVYADLPSGMSQADFDKAVIDERAWELAFEYAKRWFDLVRKKMVVEVNKDLYPNVDEHNMLLPKPERDVTAIEGLEQNEGY